MITDGFTRILDPQVSRDHGGHPIAPDHPAQLAWAYDLIEPRGRVYGVDADAILAALIEDYPTSESDTHLAAARARHALSTATALTAARHAAHLGAMSTHQEHILRIPAWMPVAVPQWDCAVPLVLVDVVYSPFTTAAAPIGNVHWLHSREADSYLLSLCEAGAVTVHRAGIS